MTAPVEHADAMGAPPGDERCPLMPTYAPPGRLFVEGDGSWLIDREGRRYLDFVSGLAVTSLGHAHPDVARTIAAQAARLVHVSNLYANEHHGPLAVAIDELVGGGGQVFLANSGAEANECALKLARRHGGRGRHVVVSAYGSFHGRTLATLHATGQPTKHEAFQPLPEGFRHVPLGDLDELVRALDPTVAAVLVETIQGEGGVWPVTDDYLRGVRSLCDERGVLMMVDEVQTGLGRTGAWFGFSDSGVRPDVVTLAKALGNGMPIGACWARVEVAASFRPGDHGSTFGGQPLAAATARTVLEVMRREDAPGRARRAGERIVAGLRDAAGVAGVRGRGLLLAVELAGSPAAPDAREVAERLARDGLLVNPVTPSALRLAPSLLVTDDEVDLAIEQIRSTLA